MKTKSLKSIICQRQVNLLGNSLMKTLSVQLILKESLDWMYTKSGCSSYESKIPHIAFNTKKKRKWGEYSTPWSQTVDRKVLKAQRP
jgi:hypothetical protein